MKEISDIIWQNIKNAAKTNKTEFNIFGFYNLSRNYRGTRSLVKQSTIFTGFWNKNTHSHNMQPFIDAGIPFLLLDALIYKFEPFGYTLSDVSSRSRSSHMVLNIKINYEKSTVPSPSPVLENSE